VAEEEVRSGKVTYSLRNKKPEAPQAS
jgi:hypothetical protein